MVPEDNTRTPTAEGLNRWDAASRRPSIFILSYLCAVNLQHLYEDIECKVPTIFDFEGMDIGALTQKKFTTAPKRQPGRPPSVNKYVFLTVRLYYEILCDLPVDLANKDAAQRLGRSERYVREVISSIKNTDGARSIRHILTFSRTYSRKGRKEIIDVALGSRISYILFKMR